MTEVSVVFPKAGDLDVQSRENVEEGQELTWKVQSFNPDVTAVKIRFNHEKATFFVKDGKPSTESPERKLNYSGGFAMATLYGTAPSTIQKAEGAKHPTGKYTVIGITDHAKIEHDPEIVIHAEPTT